MRGFEKIYLSVNSVKISGVEQGLMCIYSSIYSYIDNSEIIYRNILTTKNYVDNAILSIPTNTISVNNRNLSLTENVIALKTI